MSLFHKRPEGCFGSIKASQPRQFDVKKIVFVVGAILLAFLFWRILFPGYHPLALQSQLKTGKNTQDSEIVIKVENVLPGVYLNKKSIIGARQMQIDAYANLLSGSYSPEPMIFDKINDQAPWLSELDYFNIGSASPQHQGFSAEAINLANPFLLVSANFRKAIIEKSLKLSPEKLANKSAPLSPMPRSIVWRAKQQSAEANYELGSYLDSIENDPKAFPANGIQLLPVSYNAFDLGYAYIEVDTKDSVGIEYSDYLIGPGANVSRIMYAADGCQYPQGCNLGVYLRPMPTLKLTKLPAKVVFNLWSSKPAQTGQKADFKFTLNFK